MITKAAQIANDATRSRWSTIVLLTLIFTSMRSVVDWEIIHTDAQLFFVKLFATLIISFIVSFLVHVMLYVIFSPKPIAVVDVFEKPVDVRQDLKSVIAPRMASKPMRKAAKKKRR